MASEPHVEASLLFYPFADRFVPPDTALTAGAVLPCSGVKVQKKPLAESIVAVALWDLRQSGVIALEWFEKRRLLGRQRRLGIASARKPVDDGLSESLLGALVDGGIERNGVEDVVWRWMGRDVAQPHDVVLTRVVQRLADGGYFVAMNSTLGAVTDTWRGGSGWQPDCARIETLRSAFEGMASRWASFVVAESPLHAELLKEVGRAISRRRETSDD